MIGEYEPSTRDWARDQAELYERTGGREGALNRGKPVIVLTTLGAKTKKLRKTALQRVEHDGEYAVVASDGGKPTPPHWYFNLVANPEVELQDGPVTKDYRARLVTGEERAIWWARAVREWPDYDVYQTKTDREIQVFVLTPVEGRP